MASRVITSNSRQHSDSSNVCGIAGAIYFQNGVDAASIIFAPNQPIAPNSPDNRATGHHSFINFGSCTPPLTLGRTLENGDHFFEAPSATGRDSGNGLIQLFRAGILNVRAVLVVGGVEQHFVQASPIKYLATYCAHRKVLFFLGRKLFVFVECHCLALTHSIRPESLNVMVRSSAKETYSNSGRIFCDQLLKARILAQWVPHWIEAKIAGRDAKRHLEQMRKSGEGPV
jgi:hypothetical protein